MGCYANKKNIIIFKIKMLSFFVYLSLNLNPILKLILCTPPTKQTRTTSTSFCYCFFHIKIQTKQVWFDTLTRLIKKGVPLIKKISSLFVVLFLRRQQNILPTIGKRVLLE